VEAEEIGPQPFGVKQQPSKRISCRIVVPLLQQCGDVTQPGGLQIRGVDVTGKQDLDGFV
ncbi:MAG: hypothetical protein VX528_18895, partial [Candidatus Latescibacterota bacterium]|nr:hypothetical protein [Candidatus Latescibacterota bacterium]